MNDADLIERLRLVVEALPGGLRDHVLRVEDEAVRLAALHRLDTERLRIAALAHDLARADPEATLLERASALGIAVDAVERASPVLVHGPVAAVVLERDYGVRDAEVLAAIAWHTTARPGMSRLEKALFVADKVEHDKLSRKPALAGVRDRATTDLDAAMLRFLDLHLLEAVERRWQVHPRALEARNELLAAERPEA